MTENEAKKLITKFCEDRMNFARGMDMSDKELEDFCKFSDALTLSISSLEEIQQYRAIGTVEECREARERQRGKKPNITTGKTEEDRLACCPICEGNLDWTYNGFWRKGNPKYCSNCGQTIDWSDTP